MAKIQSLSQILACVGDQQFISPDLKVSGLAIDSREIQVGDVFLALVGHQKHGYEFARQAEQNGAVAILAETPLPQELGGQTVDIPVYEIDQLSQQLGHLAAGFYQYPSKDLKVIAVTGTNGKTSTAWLLTQALEHLEQKAAYMGTLGVGGLDALSQLSNTTPSALHIQKHLAAMVSAGYECVCMEASSHALVQGRLNGLNIDAAVLTNISQDHLDYHQTMADYARAKQRLFTDFNLRHAVINSDDDYGRQWLQAGVNAAVVNVYGQAVTGVQQLHQAKNIHLKSAGLSFQWHHSNRQNKVSSALLGRFNVDNLLAVMATLTEMGFKPTQIIEAVTKLTPVPGRMNVIQLVHKDVTVVIDFAHTPDAMAQVLTALADHCSHELWCVFGCGGDRDKSKRPQMGRIAEQYAQHVIITDDNPRFESAAQIAADIVTGMQSQPVIIHDRKAAIEQALQQSVAGDVVLIAGKGHETTQQIKDQYIEMNDFQLVQDWQEAAA